jgi:hypothetical protein
LDRKQSFQKRLSSARTRKEIDVSRVAAHNIAVRLSMESSMENIATALRSIDTDGDGQLTKAELKANLEHRKGVFRGGIHQKILSAFRQLLPRDDMVNTLQSALHSLFLFNERQMYTRTLSVDIGCMRFNYGKRFQWLLLGKPLRSTIAQVAPLNVLELSQKLGNPGPLEYTCLWLDLKATDQERMLVLGLFEVLSQVKLRADSTGESLEGFDTVDADNTEEDHSSFGMHRGRERAASHDSSASSITSDHCLGNDVDDEGIEMQPQVVNNSNGGEDLDVKARGKSQLLDMAKNHLADKDVGSVASSNPSEDLPATPSFDPDVIDFEPPTPPAAPLVDEDPVQSDIMQLRDVADELIAALETEQLTAAAAENAASIPVRNRREVSVCKSEPLHGQHHG